MKILTHPESGSPLVFPPMGGDEFVSLNRETSKEGVVAERPDAIVNRAVTVAVKSMKTDSEGNIDLDDPFAFSESKDLKRDLKWIGKRLVDVDNEATVSIQKTGRGYSLDIPDGSSPDRSEGIAVGTRVAVGPNISPKALMNAHGVVKSISGNRARVEVDKGDLDRVNRSTGKNYPSDTSFPLSSLEATD